MVCRGVAPALAANLTPSILRGPQLTRRGIGTQIMQLRATHLSGRAARTRILVTALACLCAAGTVEGAPRLIGRAAEVRALTPKEAARGYPVRLRGVVTYYDRAAPDLFVQDGTAGIYVTCDQPPAVERGQLVEVTGITGPGDFAPVVLHPQVRVLGPGELPKPPEVTFDTLVTGRLDSQWIEGEGVVKSAKGFAAELFQHVANVRIVTSEFSGITSAAFVTGRDFPPPSKQFLSD